MIIVIGLGNVGLQYQNTFHNLGFRVVDRLSKKVGLEFKKEKYKAYIAQGYYKGKPLILAKPTTYMNNSGQCAILLKKKFKDARIIVAVDDIDLPKGTIRYREHGSSGTHNGLRSLTQFIGEDFERVRIGIGRDNSKDLADYVLSNIKGQDADIFEQAIDKASDLIIEKIETNTDCDKN